MSTALSEDLDKAGDMPDLSFYKIEFLNTQAYINIYRSVIPLDDIL